MANNKIVIAAYKARPICLRKKFYSTNLSIPRVGISSEAIA